MKKHEVHIGIGSNLGKRLDNINSALCLLEKRKSIRIVSRSSIYETEPSGYKDQNNFLNCAVKIKTGLSCMRLLGVLKTIEKKLLRKPSRRWGPRTIDLDILLYEDLILKTRDLVIPHPQMHKRAFVLAPLGEISPGAVHPTIKKTIRSLARAAGKKGLIRKL
ncbi:MAG: 2-amino-4-hydroxy-6-hydroxymethyldihydropteridine diphosphokinase [bacterium]